MCNDIIQGQRQFHHHFQPIINVTSNTTLGYEALFRSTYFTKPEQAFNEARRTNQLFDLEIQSIENAMTTYHHVFSKSNTCLFINIYPSTLLNPNFINAIKHLLIDCHSKNPSIIFEILETEAIHHYRSLKDVLVKLKIAGCFIALDDGGVRQASLKNMIELEPNYIKLDRYFSKDLSQFEKKMEIISFILSYCEKYNCQLILEGIEDEQDLEVARGLGVTFAQGYLFGKPAKLENLVKTHHL